MFWSNSIKVLPEEKMRWILIPDTPIRRHFFSLPLPMPLLFPGLFSNFSLVVSRGRGRGDWATVHSGETNELIFLEPALSAAGDAGLLFVLRYHYGTSRWDEENWIHPFSFCPSKRKMDKKEKEAEIPA